MEIIAQVCLFFTLQRSQVSLCDSVVSPGRVPSRCSPSPKWVAPVALSLGAEGPLGERAAVASTLGNKSVI